ncbi:hypothetical protein [Pontibacter pamirensis]|uniref:hypothetical protein n=1 Tax=Pontibacter pamirensis TaxID=2562824 RepID=UPI0013897802|nr:hypothetical protein [Pontibacter pamirensis]
MKTKLLLWVLLMLLTTVPFNAKSQGTDSLAHKRWYQPDGVVLQYAGNMGFLSVGPSYSLAKNKLNVELLYGFVPKYDAEEALHLLTLKGVWLPLKEVKLNNDYTLTPLRAGLGASYYFNDQFPLTWKDGIPAGYYWWSSGVRVLGFAGAGINRNFGDDKTIKGVSLYSEIGTYDLILTSWVKDERLTLWEIANLSLGVRIKF